MATPSTPKQVIDLVERFDRNRDAYLSGAYNEMQLRREFIDPFSKTLGWRKAKALTYDGIGV